MIFTGMDEETQNRDSQTGSGLPAGRKPRDYLIFAIVFIIATGMILTIAVAIQTDRIMREDLLMHARFASAGIDTTKVSALSGSPADLASPIYQEIKIQLAEVRAADPDLRFAYLIGQRPDGMYFFYADSEPPDSADYSPPGQEYTEATPLIINGYSRGQAMTDGPASDRWGTWVSAVVPVNDQAGRRLAVFGIDEDARDWFRQIVVACLTPVAATLLVLALVLSFSFIQQRNERERRNLEASRKTLKESEERYRLLFSQSPLGILHLDTRGVVRDANQKFAEIVGISTGEIIGFDVPAKLKNPGLVSAVRQALAGTTGFYEGEFVSERSRGHLILRVLCQPVGLQEKSSGVICIVDDITERWQAEQREKQQNTFFSATQRVLMELSRAPIGNVPDFFSLITRTDATILGVSRVSIWWFSSDQSEMVCAGGYGCEPAPGSGPARLKRTDYPRYFQALDENRIIDAHDARTDERTAEFTASYLVPLEISSMLDVPIRRGEQVIGILCHEHTGEKRIWSPLEQDFAAAVADLVSSVIERTERMAAEAALRESEQRYRNVVEDQTELIARFRPDRTLVFVNDAFCRFFHRDRNQLIGEKFSPRVLDEDRALAERHLTAFSHEKPVYEISYRILRPDGQVSWLLWINRATFDDQGMATEIQSVGRDITAQKQTAEALSLVNQKLNLLSSITRHDALNQLLILRGFLKLADDLADNPAEARRFLEKATKALLTIENQIIFTRDYQDMGVTAPSWQGIRKSIVFAKGALPPVDIRIELDHPEIEIRADRLLEKVFYNLIDNAIRYGGEKMKTIRFTSREVPEGLVIIVEDDGIGISTEDKPRLFTRGFGRNTGFGLFLSREILSISGISITETGTYGKGARFEILVPHGNFRYPESSSGT